MSIMSADQYQPPEAPSAELAPVEKAQGRGYFFYIAVFFIVVATICFFLSSPSFNLSLGVPPATTSTTPK